MMKMLDSCFGRTALSGVTGFASGGIVGFVLSGMRFEVPIASGIPASMGGRTRTTMRPLAGLPLRDQLKHISKDTINGSWRAAKNFGLITAMYEGGKCAIEGLRAKDDLYNGGMAACATGSWWARAAGPRGCAVGCLGFAAFKTAVDMYTDARGAEDRRGADPTRESHEG